MRSTPLNFALARRQHCMPLSGASASAGHRIYGIVTNLSWLFTLVIIFVLPSFIHGQNTFPATGNVGIGTTSPANLLAVRGSIYTNGTMQVDGGDVYISRTSTAFGYVLRPNAAGYRNLQFAVTGGEFLGNGSLNTSGAYYNCKVGAEPTYWSELFKPLHLRDDWMRC